MMYIRWRNEWTTPAVVGVVSFAAGVAAGAVGYKVRLDRQIERDAEAIKYVFGDIKVPTSTVLKVDEGLVINEIFTGHETIKDLPVGDHRDEAYISPVQRELENKLEENAGKAMKEYASEQLAQQNVFDEDWNQEEEEAERSPGGTYVLHVDEFMNNESGFPQLQLDWYDKDKILCDENNVVIPDNIVGKLEWGRGSRDPDIVYIRNEKLRAEYEVTRIDDSFMVAVHGMDAEQEADQDDLRHSQSIRRFRQYRD